MFQVGIEIRQKEFDPGERQAALEVLDNPLLFPMGDISGIQRLFNRAPGSLETRNRKETHGQNHDVRAGIKRTLRGRVERAHGLDTVSKKLDPQGVPGERREEIDYPPPDADFALFLNQRNPPVAPLQAVINEVGQRQFTPNAQPEGGGNEFFLGQEPLQQGRCRGDENGRTDREQVVQPLNLGGDDLAVGRQAVGHRHVPGRVVAHPRGKVRPDKKAQVRGKGLGLLIRRQHTQRGLRSMLQMTSDEKRAGRPLEAGQADDVGSRRGGTEPSRCLKGNRKRSSVRQTHIHGRRVSGWPVARRRQCRTGES